MKARFRVLVASSFVKGDISHPHGRMGRRNRWFHGFVQSLLKSGSSLHRFDIRFLRLPDDPEDVAAVARAAREESVDLVICPGTDAAVRWTRVEIGVPTLYFGAHPENNGLELIERPNVSGVRLSLPLVWSFDTFALLRALLADLKSIYIPLNRESEFAFANVRAGWNLWRRRGGDGWIPGSSSCTGHRSVHFLAERLGCRSFEGPYSTLSELENHLSAVPEGLAQAVVCFNDTVLLEGAVERVLFACRERELPLFWVNNPAIVEAGGLADFSSHFEAVGRIIGEQSMQILDERVPIGDIPFADDPGERLALNQARCHQLGLQVTPAVAARFHEHVGVS